MRLQNVTGTALTRPKRSIRRFDVFAEYTKQEQEDKGLSEPRAMGYGLWLAKVVASRRFGASRAKAGTPSVDDQERSERPERESEWRTLDDEPQTDELFGREIVQRMGPDFYCSVFAPAIREARRQGRSYEGIRDAIRKDWKPAR
jgi:hypothetical protein